MLSMNNMVCLTRKEVFNSEKKEFVENNQGGGGCQQFIWMKSTSSILKDVSHEGCNTRTGSSLQLSTSPYYASGLLGMLSYVSMLTSAASPPPGRL